jgi:glycine/D-amino acid oxidase-like deaminating enzyme
MNHPALNVDLEADVAIIGAGITGLTVADQLAKEGLNVVVLERQTVGAGEASHTTAHLTARLATRGHARGHSAMVW